MFVRIVKMSFDPALVTTFVDNFNQNKTHIRNFEGCKRLELLQDKSQTNVFFTYSYWKSDAHLEAYRNSDLFKRVWSKTKPLFNARPEAWSVEKIEILH